MNLLPREKHSLKPLSINSEDKKDQVMQGIGFLMYVTPEWLINKKLYLLIVICHWFRLPVTQNVSTNLILN